MRGGGGFLASRFAWSFSVLGVVILTRLPQKVNVQSMNGHGRQGRVLGLRLRIRVRVQESESKFACFRVFELREVRAGGIPVLFHFVGRADLAMNLTPSPGFQVHC